LSCSSRREYMREYMRRWRANPINHLRRLLAKRRYDSTRRQYNADYQRALRNDRRYNKQCIRCGAPLVEEEDGDCFACLTSGHKAQVKGVI